jgi:hypothetical protein
LKDARLGRGKYLQQSIRKYGKDNFSIKEIFKCKNLESLNKMEIFFIRKYDSTNPDKGYNLTFGGDGGRMNDEVQRNRSNKQRGENNPNFGGKSITKKQLLLAKINTTKYFKNPENRIKMSERMKGNIPWNKGLKLGSDYGAGGRKNKGLKRSEEVKQKMSLSRKGENHPMFGRKHSEESKLKNSISTRERLKRNKQVLIISNN